MLAFIILKPIALVISSVLITWGKDYDDLGCINKLLLPFKMYLGVGFLDIHGSFTFKKISESDVKLKLESDADLWRTVRLTTFTINIFYTLPVLITQGMNSYRVGDFSDDG